MFNRFDVRLFNSFKVFTSVPNFFAIEYRESPLWTVYVVSSPVSLGIDSTWHMLNRFDVKLFAVFMASTVVLNSLAIEYKESPLFTVYVIPVCSSSGVGSFSTCPIDN